MLYCQSSLGKGWIVWGSWTLPECREAWAGRFKPRGEMHSLPLEPTMRPEVGWTIFRPAGPRRHVVHSGSEKKGAWGPTVTRKEDQLLAWSCRWICNSRRTVFWMGEGTLGTALDWSGRDWLGFPLGALEGMGFEAGGCHPPRLCSFWIKDLFPLLPNLCPWNLPMGGGKQQNPNFCSVPCQKLNLRYPRLQSYEK